MWDEYIIPTALNKGYTVAYVNYNDPKQCFPITKKEWNDPQNICHGNNQFYVFRIMK